MFTINRLLILFFFSSFLIGAQANESEEKQQRVLGWNASLEGSIIATSGNTETTTLRTKLDAYHNTKHWENHYIFDALFKEEEVEEDDGIREKQKSAERYFLSTQNNYKMPQQDEFLLLYFSHLDDKFGSFKSNTIFSIGYGWTILENNDHRVDFELGPGYRFAERDSGEDVNGAILRSSLKYQWHINDQADFEQNVSIESGSENTYTRFETSIRTKITDSFSMKIGFVLANNSVVDEGDKNVDTETTMSLIYDF